jgi:hypothetical protein
MPRPCAVCAHPDRQNIDRALIGGSPKSVVSRRWQLSPDATERHAKLGHIVRNEFTTKAEEVLPQVGDNLLEKLQELIRIVEHLMERCVQNNQWMGTLACARELTRIWT